MRDISVSSDGKQWFGKRHLLELRVVAEYRVIKEMVELCSDKSVTWSVGGRDQSRKTIYGYAYQ
jgi:hypothetical protein